MLFPGAIVSVVIVLVIIGGCFSIAVGCLGGLAGVTLFESVVQKTKLYKRMVRGENVGGSPWWIDYHRWFFYGWSLTTCIVAYTITGPLWSFVEWLK